SKDTPSTALQLAPRYRLTRSRTRMPGESGTTAISGHRTHDVEHITGRRGRHGLLAGTRGTPRAVAREPRETAVSQPDLHQHPSCNCCRPGDGLLRRHEDGHVPR